MTAVILEADGTRGKRYRADETRDSEIFQLAIERLAKLDDQAIGGLPALPNEPIPYDPQNLKVRTYGMMTWQELFNARQLVALTTFARLVREAHVEMSAAGLDPEYTKAVATYLGLAVDRLADYNSTITRWASNGEYVGNTFTRQALPIVWDYCEVSGTFGKTGGFLGAVEWITAVIDDVASIALSATDVALRDSRDPRDGGASIVLTDPPYYDSINYANLADFFYVWLKRSVGDLYPKMFTLPLASKREQIVMDVYLDPAVKGTAVREAARAHYVDGMAASFQAMQKSLGPGGVVGVVFAHTDPDAWSTLIEGLLHTELIPDASWPIDTELENKASRLGQARLSTSVWMVCTPRVEHTGEAFLGDVIGEMRPVIRERLLYFWSKGIRGADFFISAIGPALSVFGRRSRVLRPSGEEVTVREFLDLVRKEATDVALEQVLGGNVMGVLDALTRHYVTWVWSYSRAPLDAGETIALCLATGADYGEAVRPGSIAVEAKEKSKKMVKLLTIRERGSREENLGLDTPARPAPLIDQLQRSAYLWGQNRPDQLGAFRAALGETRWSALRTLGQAVAECLPQDDEDRRLILGLLGSNVMASAAVQAAARDRIATKPRFEGME
jgi:adenine-specific DNA methylase